MYAMLHLDINSLKSSLFHSISQPIYQQGRGKVKDGIIFVTKLLGTI
jgi:hypothetical protein